jgi:signal transduction histidine kinase
VALRGEADRVHLSSRVSSLAAEKSAFNRVAVLLANPDGRIVVAASAGMDDSTLQALNVWGESIAARGPDDPTVLRARDRAPGVPVGAKSFTITLAARLIDGGLRRAIVTPLWTISGQMLGALAVGADNAMNVRRSALAKALEPLERLSFKLERSIENAALAERLVRAQNLAGLGLLAGGMVHALNNPLTAVLGFAELIVDTTGEARVKEDAEIIVREALRIRETVEKLTEFWQPAEPRDEMVDLAELVRCLAADCVERLEKRGVSLVLQLGDDSVNERQVVRGDADRLRHMMEHLLNNAAEAVAWAQAAERVIRVSMGRVSLERCGERVHILVSDTGPGFRDLARVFEVSDAGGLGLSVCHRIVHEHGGEISAFNMHPHGAAVALDLPLADCADKKSETGVAQVVV